MKIAIASDVHLEFGDLFIKNEEQADVLILSGDICVAKDLKTYDAYGIMEGTRSQRVHEFFLRCCFQFPHVIYVVGNHEHYNGDYATTIAHLKTVLAHNKNLYILDKELKTIDGVHFVGGTMWTNMNNRHPLTMFHIKSMMNDFRCVENSDRLVYRTVPLYEKDAEGNYVKDEKGSMIQSGTKKKAEPALFSPEDAVEDHEKFIECLKICTDTLGENPDKYVVVTHHTPSQQSCHPIYAHDTLMNGGYHTNLEDLIMDRPCIKLWTHGHTHEDFDYTIGDTRVVCNPRGYVKYEARAKTWALKYVEV